MPTAMLRTGQSALLFTVVLRKVAVNITAKFGVAESGNLH
jgi:hypothetical protein